MKQLTAAIVLLAVGRLAGAASLPAEVLGTWGLTEAAADLVATNCRSNTYRFDATTLTLTDGEMVLRTRYELESEAAGGATLSLRQVVIEHNARPNCRGALSSVVPGQRIHNLLIELQGDRLRLHLPEQRGGTRHVDLVRPTRLPATITATPSSGPAMPTVNVVHVADPTAAKPKCPDLDYPEPSLREGAQGTTRIRFVIDAAGRATQPLITHGAGMTRAHKVLDRAATESLVKCQFPVDEPARERTSVIDYVWRLPDAGRLPGQ